MYMHKKLSNTTAEQKHCLPKDVWSQEGKNTPLNLLEVAYKEGQLLTEPAPPPQLPTDTSITPALNAPRDARLQKHLVFRPNTHFFKMRETITSK